MGITYAFLVCPTALWLCVLGVGHDVGGDRELLNGKLWWMKSGGTVGDVVWKCWCGKRTEEGKSPCREVGEAALTVIRSKSTDKGDGESEVDPG